MPPRTVEEKKVEEDEQFKVCNVSNRGILSSAGELTLSAGELTPSAGELTPSDGGGRAVQGLRRTNPVD
eukprot:5882947-Pyramimonas_sp.AAC.1